MIQSRRGAVAGTLCRNKMNNRPMIQLQRTAANTLRRRKMKGRRDDAL